MKNKQRVKMKKINEYKEPNLETVVQRVKSYLEEEWEYSQEKLSIVKKTYANYVKPTKDQFEAIEDEITDIWNLNSVRNSDKIEEVVKELIPMFNEHSLKFQLDKRFYEALLEIRDNDGEMSDVERKHLLKLIKDYELEGIHLPEDKKKELSTINERLSLLSNEFSTNIIEANKVFKYDITEQDAQDLPEIEAQKLKKEDGSYCVDSINGYLSFMKYSPNRDKRTELHELYATRAPENEELINQILELREEKRKLLGFDSFASLVLEKRNANSVSEIEEMLEFLTQKAKPKAREEILGLGAYARSKDGIDKFGVEDLSYYSELYRKEYYNVDQNEYKPYFEVSTVVAGFIDFIKEYTGVEFVRNTSSEMQTWHEDVMIYDLINNGEIMGRIYYDLHERENKSSGAWKGTKSKYHIDHKGDTVLPICNVVCNYEKKNEEGKSFLTHSDVVTFFHEMGHAIHHLFSKVEVSSLSGTSVDWDVVEFPSQFLEYFAYEKDVLQKFAKHYETALVLPEEMIEKLQNAKNYLNGYSTMRQAEFAIFDIKLHKGGVPDALETLHDVRGETSVMDVPEYDRFHHTFGHIFSGGYAAGYYSYKWAEILSAGAYYKVKESENPVEKFNQYRSLVLEKGGVVDMVEQYKKLTGESPNPINLLKMDGIVSE